MDYDKHNAEVAEVWQAYRAGRPVRVPMVLGISAQWTLSMPAANRSGITFAQYMNDPLAMLQHQLEARWWVRHRVVFDQEMGLPDAWEIHVDGQNIFEAGWLGAKVVVHRNGPPSAVPAVGDDNKWQILDAGIPDPFEGKWATWNWERYEFFKQQEEEGLEFCGRLVRAGMPVGLGTDGPLTVSYQLRGAEGLLVDMRTDPDFFHALMAFVTEATIERMTAYRRRLGQPASSESFGFADDAVALLSVQDYRDHVLPYHKKLVAVFGSKGPNSIHLCGDATHLFPTIRDELNVRSFDTGYPVDFGRLRQELGPDVEILGGPRVDLVRAGPPEAIEARVKQIMDSGVREGGRFILREGNNVAPKTPPEHIAAMYQACKRYGRY